MASNEKSAKSNKFKKGFALNKCTESNKCYLLLIKYNTILNKFCINSSHNEGRRK